MAGLDHFFLVCPVKTMSSLTPAQLKVLAPSTDQLVTKIPAIVATEHHQYTTDDHYGNQGPSTIIRAPQDVVNRVRRGEIIFRKKVNDAESSSVSHTDGGARKSVAACSSVNGFGSDSMTVGDVRKEVVILGVSEIDASTKDIVNFPIIAKGVMTVPALANEPIRAGTIVLAVLLTEDETQKMIRNRKAHPDVVEGKRTFIYKSVGRSELLRSAQQLASLNNVNALSVAEKAVVEMRAKLLAAQTDGEKDRWNIMLARAIAALSVDEEAYVVGEALTSADPGPENAFDLRISVG